MAAAIHPSAPTGAAGGRPKETRRAPWALLLALQIPVSFTMGGCSGKQGGQQSTAHAASSAEAQQELRAIEEEWELGSSIRRQALRPRIEAFIERFPTDPSTDRARVLLARIALDEGRFGAAEEALQPVLSAPTNRVRDEATLVLAAVRNRQNRPDEALDLLAPLDGKLLTAEARFEYAQETARAALADRRWRLLVDTMTTWIAETGHLEKEAKDWCTKALEQVPAPALSRLLADWHEQAVPTDKRAAHEFIQRAIIERLSRQALTRKDARLARDLLRQAPPWLRASELGDELSLLAALAQDEVSVSGRLVGVVLGGAFGAQRRRTISVGVGLMQGLRLGEGPPPAGAVTLIAEEHRGSVRTALASLSGQGAAVLVAAVDPVSAMEALAFAESRRVPVVVLTPPVGLATLSPDYGFSVGVSLEQQQEVMRQSSPGRSAFVGTTATACPSSRIRPGMTALPFDEWQAEGVLAVGILGDATCAWRVVSESRASGFTYDILLGLDASAAGLPGLPAGRSYYYVQAGHFPESLPPPTSDEFHPGEDRTSPTRPGWFQYLGRDLAELLRVALADLPETVTSNPEEVRLLHDRARDALLHARAQLLTTDSDGFGGHHVLPRKLTLKRGGDTP